MQKYDRNNYEFKKPSGVIQSKIFKIVNKKRVHYELNPIQFDTMNLMMYKVKESLIVQYGSTDNIIDKIQNDYDTFEKIIDTHWYEISLSELFNFVNRSQNNHSIIHEALDELTEVKIKTNIFDKNKNVGQTTFNLIRKYSKFKNKIKFKLEPELFQMILLQKPLTDESFAVLRLKIQAQNLKTVGSKRLYEFLKDWEFRNTVTVTISDIKMIMNLDENKTNNQIYATINRDHIKKAVNEINYSSDIKVSYTPIKEKSAYGRLQVTKIKFLIEPQHQSKLDELGLTPPKNNNTKFYNKSKNKLDKLISTGYKVIDETLWIETDIKKNEERYDAEVRIDTWLKNTPQDDRNKIYELLAKSMDDCDEQFITIDGYLIKGVFSNDAYTKNPMETIAVMNSFLGSLTSTGE
jgi:hypothetical protein